MGKSMGPREGRLCATQNFSINFNYKVSVLEKWEEEVEGPESCRCRWSLCVHDNYFPAAGCHIKTLLLLNKLKMYTKDEWESVRQPNTNLENYDKR